MLNNSLQKNIENLIAGRRIFYIFAAGFSQKIFRMTGITAKRNSVSVPKTAVSCGQALSAAIQLDSKLGDNPSATIPETVIIGDRGLLSQAANSAPQTASPAISLLNNQLTSQHNDQRSPHHHLSITRRRHTGFPSESLLRQGEA